MGSLSTINFMITVNKNIKELRNKKGWSQEKLAFVSGVPYKTLVKIEQGISKGPTIQTVYKIAKALCVNIDSLIDSKMQ